MLPFLNLTDNANVFTGVDDAATEFKFPVPFYFNGSTYVNGFVSYHKISIKKWLFVYSYIFQPTH